MFELLAPLALNVPPSITGEEERLRRGEIVLGLGGMPEGFWEMPRPHFLEAHPMLPNRC
jgi:hypothetical protein